MLKKALSRLAILFVALTLVACAAPAAPAGDAAQPADAAADASADTAATGDTGADASSYRFAAIFPGPITDADYNTLGYNGIQKVGEEYGMDVAYSESVAVPDVDRVMREYVDDGFNIIFTHGSQFVNQTKDLAVEFPDVVFIAEFDAPVEDAPDNLWVIDRNFHVGFYAVGALAGNLTESGTVGYIGGLTLPFSYAEVHAMQQAIADAGVAVTLNPVWAGDFNDPSKARELAEAMIADGADVLVGSLNLGMLGIFEAAKNASSPVRVVAKYTDKSSFAPDNYVTSVLYDFEGPLTDIAGQIVGGATGGYYPLGFDTGVAIQTPLLNADEETAAAVDAVISGLLDGSIEVVKNVDPIE
ncbi:MAG: BMP family protein [Caldilineaceae bacterium]|nr:BMP family protein [Caldilineaceae bacterium]